MPELDYALLCDYARAEGGVAHVIAAGIDTIHRPEVPNVANLGLLARIIFADEETGEAHEVEVRLRDQEGDQIAGQPDRRPASDRRSPRGLADRRAVGHELRSAPAELGLYTLTILLDDTPKKTLNLRVVPAEDTDGSTG